MAYMSIADRVLDIRAGLLQDDPCFGAPSLKLTLKEDPTCATAWVDGVTMGYNPAFVEGLSDAQLTGLLAHETGHCALGHPWRRGAREPRLYNVACDYVLNGMLLAAGYTLPDGALVDPQFNGLSVEYVYDRLAAAQTQDPQSGKGKTTPQADRSSEGQQGPSTASPEQGDGQPDASTGVPGPAQPGEVRDAPPDEAGKSGEAEWRQAMAQAVRMAAAQGKLAGGLAREIGKAMATRRDWVSELLKYAAERCTDDYSMRRPNKRYIGHGFYLPSLDGQCAGRIAVGVDTSGSVDAVMLGQFADCLSVMLDTLKPTAMDVYVSDAAVHAHYTFHPGETIKLEPLGGGGTDFRPVFNAVAQGDDPPVFMVYLTDLWGTFPEAEPEYPVVWAVAGLASHNPWGERIPIA